MATEFEARIDTKFVFSAVCVEHGHSHSHHDGMLFLAHDVALPETLRAYRKASQKHGARPAQLIAIDALIHRVVAWQKAHPATVKVADIDEEPGRKKP